MIFHNQSESLACNLMDWTEKQPQLALISVCVCMKLIEFTQDWREHVCTSLTLKQSHLVSISVCVCLEADWLMYQVYTRLTWTSSSSTLLPTPISRHFTKISILDYQIKLIAWLFLHPFTTSRHGRSTQIKLLNYKILLIIFLSHYLSFINCCISGQPAKK